MFSRCVASTPFVQTISHRLTGMHARDRTHSLNPPFIAAPVSATRIHAAEAQGMEMSSPKNFTYSVCSLATLWVHETVTNRIMMGRAQCGGADARTPCELRPIVGLGPHISVRVRAMREREYAAPSVHDPPINLVSPSPSAPRPSVNTATNAVSEEKTSPPSRQPPLVGGLRGTGLYCRWSELCIICGLRSP